MKHLLKRSLSLLLAAVLLLCVGCATEPRDERLSLDYAIERMDALCEEEEIVILFYTGLMGISSHTWANDDFEAALRLAEWEPLEMDLKSEEFEEQRLYEIVLEHTENSTYSLHIGYQYGAVERIDYTEEERAQTYYGGVCFKLPQNDEGEIADALEDLIASYVAETGDEGCMF